MKKVFIGNLDYSVKSDDLREHFSEAGEIVDAVVISDKQTGRSRGFGFVEFSSEDEAKKAIDLFNGKEFKGRELVVNEAKPQQR